MIFKVPSKSLNEKKQYNLLEAERYLNQELYMQTYSKPIVIMKKRGKIFGKRRYILNY